MFADRKNTSSPGLRALLGRLLYGLFPHRFLQLLGAAWSYLMGPWDASSFLPSGWFFHRSVQSGELPEVLEVLGLRQGSWEELGECLEELGPWKELPSEVDLLKSWKELPSEVDLLKSWKELPSEVDLLKSWKELPSEVDLLKSWKELPSEVDLLKSWKGDDESAALSDLAAWQKAMVHRNMQVFWEPALTSWNILTNPHEDDQCCKQVFSPTEQMRDNDTEAHKVSPEKQPPSVGLISCILNVGESGALARVEKKEEQVIDAAVDGSNRGEFEIQQIRNKRLRFLERKEAQEDFTCDGKEKKQELVPDPPEHFPSPSQLVSDENADISLSQCHESQQDIIRDQSELCDLMVFPETDEMCSSCNKLPVVVEEGDKSDNLHHLCPDKDQGYHSLEYWQCPPLLQNTTTTCVSHSQSVLPTEPPSCPSSVKDENEDLNCDLNDESPISSVTSCTNKHIGYILGTVVSDDDDDDDLNSSSGDEWDKEEKEEEEEEEDDDGFDSEGSISSTDSETNVSKDILWNSFSSADPYNPQNFTASIHTGAVTGENVLSLDILDHHHQSDEESWCDSDADSDSDSDCSADEGENLKLWNAFLKSDDPYNPLQFKAPVQTSDKKRQCSDITRLEMTSRNLPNHKVSLVTCQAYDLHQLQCTEPHNVPLEDGANRGHKKVTFQEKVTIYYVCNEEQRKGHWEELARDRCRFQRRIKETELVIGHCLSPHHRQRAWERMQGQWGS